MGSACASAREVNSFTSTGIGYEFEFAQVEEGSFEEGWKARGFAWGPAGYEVFRWYGGEDGPTAFLELVEPPVEDAFPGH